jgi:hypothetical protein
MKIIQYTGLILLGYCKYKKENSKMSKPKKEKCIRTQLLIVSLVYHAIGIFYNE